jgi:uncharacterized lipoprotein YmbA
MNHVMNSLLRSSLRLTAIGALLFAAGCSLPQAQPDTTRYFVLGSPSPKAPATDSTATGVRVAVRTIQLPSFLRGKAMQVRVAGNELSYADDSRWAETLEAGIGRVLRDSLEGRPGIARVVVSPGEPHDFDIAVTVLRCEGDRDAGVARFVARYEIISTAPGAEKRARETFSLEVPGWDRQSYGQLAQKLSEAVDALGEKIATSLK